MNEINTKMVKARSTTKMMSRKEKVHFYPSKANVQRLEKANQVHHVRNVNDIVRFESKR